MSKRRRICLRGHDTFICGRHASGGCRDCSRDRSARRQRYPRCVPPEPLLKWLARHDLTIAVAWGKRSAGEKEIYRAKRRVIHPILGPGHSQGMTVVAADKLATSLGVHPFEIWHEDWWTYDAVPPEQREDVA